MAKKLHFLDELALQWEQDDEKFFLDVPFSDDYVQVNTPVGTKHAWQVDKHEILESRNLESIFEDQYRTDKHDKFVPLFDMLGEMFREGNFAPAELDLGTATLYSEAKLTDLISGVEGNLGHQGWSSAKNY